MADPSAVAIYARISLDAEGTALGVKRQLMDCRALAERLGWVVAEEYVDNDVSAYSGKRRPAYQRMLDDVAAGVRDAVIVYHVDRLTRRPIELEQFVEIVQKAGVRHVRFVSSDVDITNGDGLLVLRRWRRWRRRSQHRSPGGSAARWTRSPPRASLMAAICVRSGSRTTR